MIQETRLNIELLKAVRDKITAVPAAYKQSTIAELNDTSPCGTAACIGGWADILSASTDEERAQRMSGAVSLDRAANALGLSGRYFICELPVGPERTERAVLFDASPAQFWPEPFATRYGRAKSSAERAKVAVAYLDHIIETGKVLE